MTLTPLGDLATVHESVLDEALKAYDPSRIPQAFADLPRSLVRRAFHEAGGDWRRVVRDGDERALTVLNRACW